MDALLVCAADPSVMPTNPLQEWEVALRLGVAVLMGMVIGWERSKAEKPADVRTMALVAAGAAGFTLLGVQLAAEATPDSGLNLDPTRVISYIISGVGFLGAGAILHSKKSVTGLTTAASIWIAAAIGAACGLGAFPIAIGLFLVAAAMLWVPWFTGPPRNGNGHHARERPK